MMPMRVIGMLLGIPESEQVSVRDANDANLRTKRGAPMKVASADKIADGSIYADYVEWRSHNPSDDLMTALLNMEFEDEHGVTRKLTARKCCTTRRWSPVRAMRPPDGSSAGWRRFWQSIPTSAARWSRIEAFSFVRSMRRCGSNPPVRTLHATRQQDFELYDATVSAGSAILLLFGAANRDPARYENPDTFDIHRDNISHLTFRQGRALLPWSQSRQARGEGSARRAAEPLARVGYRLRDNGNGSDVDRARLGEAADRLFLRVIRRASAETAGRVTPRSQAAPSTRTARASDPRRGRG